MKKICSVICVLLLLSLCACSNAQSKEPSAITSAASTTDLTVTEDRDMEENKFYIKTSDTSFTASFADNSSADAFKELLEDGDLTINLHDYGSFEKVGSLGHTLPRNDMQITTEAGDIILYQGNQVTIYYDTNSWSFTRLGKIEGVTKEDLLSAFGKGNVRVTFSLNKD